MTPQELRDRAARAKAASTSTVQITASEALDLAEVLEALALITETTDSDLVNLLGLTPHILAGRLLAVHELAREARR